jgi:hypothetical protein
VRILFDQGTPVPLRRSLTGHVVATAYELGWSTVTNGDLIRLAEQEGYELLLTTDTNLRYQQNLHLGADHHQLATDSPGHWRNSGGSRRYYSGRLPGAAHSLSLSAAATSAAATDQ